MLYRFRFNATGDLTVMVCRHNGKPLSDLSFGAPIRLHTDALCLAAQEPYLALSPAALHLLRTIYREQARAGFSVAWTGALHGHDWIALGRLAALAPRLLADDPGASRPVLRSPDRPRACAGV